jgi:hypothetical protein
MSSHASPGALSAAGPGATASPGARDWKKAEKALYLPPAEPRLVLLPAFSFFAIRGRGDPNASAFQDYVGVLYSLSYALRMSYKWDEPPAGYETYAVYPLEGVWDVSDEAKSRAAIGAEAPVVGAASVRAPVVGSPVVRASRGDAVGGTAAGGKLDKGELVFRLMIRQPGFVTPALAERAAEVVRRKKPSPLLGSAEFVTLEEGSCVQMLHKGSYDDEPASFRRMEAFCAAEGLARKSLTHREIYLSDPRSSDPAKLRTVLRFQVEKNG